VPTTAVGTATRSGELASQWCRFDIGRLILAECRNVRRVHHPVLLSPEVDALAIDRGVNNLFPLGQRNVAKTEFRYGAADRGWDDPRLPPGIRCDHGTARHGQGRYPKRATSNLAK